MVNNKLRFGISGGYGKNMRAPNSNYKPPKQSLYFAEGYCHYTLYQKKVGFHIGGLLRYEKFSYSYKMQDFYSYGHRKLDIALGYHKIRFNPLLCISFNETRYRRFYFEIKVPLGDVFYSAFKFDYLHDWLDRNPTPDVWTIVNDNRQKRLVATGSMLTPYLIFSLHCRVN